VAVLLILMYTPVGSYVPIPNPALERKYGRALIDTRDRLNALAEQVAVLSNYNAQLRKALGETGSRDTSEGVPGARPAQNEQRRRPVPATPVTGDAGTREQAPETPARIVTQAVSDYGAFPLIEPAQGVLVQGFDPPRNHFGIDISAPVGTPVYAATQGHIVFAGWTHEDGNVIIISHSGGYATVYKHTRTILRPQNSTVGRGELIALVGNTGQTSQGPHLHFEVLKDGIPRNPRDYLLTSTSPL
jgi:murein DD-endopeptidase MepM/ murein hydrolase activator NlpD